MLRSKSFVTISAFVIAVATANVAFAYPTNTCVALKQKAASKLCNTAAKAWAKYHSNPSADAGGTSRDAAIAAGVTKLGEDWTKAEGVAMKRGVDCAVTTVDSTNAASQITTVLDSVESIVTATLDTTVDAGDQKCASGILKSVAKMCSGILKANSKHVKKPGSDRSRAKLQFGTDKAAFKFQSGYDKSAPRCTGTAPAANSISSAIDAATSDFVESTITSPGITPGSFIQVPFNVGDEVDYDGDTLRPVCSKNTPYSFWYRRGTVNKLVMYYQGGGACWSAATCFTANTFKNTAGAGDNPDLVGAGFADSTNPDNPFKDWHMVFVSYCTGDVHWGNNAQFYGPGQTINHVGRVNAKVAEKFAREHFPLPEQVFVTGSSAGSYGALLNSVFLMEDVYPSSPHDVLGDAGIGVITQGWLESSFPVWNVQENLPTHIPDLNVPAIELSTVEMWEHIARYYPNNDFAAYQSAYDGSGGGQTAFYNVMANPNDILTWPTWWPATCTWNACMRQMVEDIASRVPNFAYYTGAGSRHTVYGSDKLYEDTTGGMPVLVDWIQAMVDDDDPNWASQHCGGTGFGPGCDLVDTCQQGANAGLPCTSDVDCPGGSCEEDPRPSPADAPYEPGGVVNCPATVCPCGTGPTDIVCGLD
jgi:hypothetical protein